jgi:hypothetical protein
VQVQLPHRILEDPQAGFHLPESRYEFETLYADHPAFAGPKWTSEECFGATEWRPARLAADRDRWKENYERLARAFPVSAMLWIRRRCLGIPDPARDDGRRPPEGECQ